MRSSLARLLPAAAAAALLAAVAGCGDDKAGNPRTAEKPGLQPLPTPGSPGGDGLKSKKGGGQAAGGTPSSQ